jgi:phosphoserine phosphatase RsbU/P
MKPARILVVDDEPGMLRAVERVLSVDHQVVATGHSREALAIAAEFQPELAIVDIRMPGMDGFELMAQLKAHFPRLDVILMTGSVDDLDEKLIRAIRSAAFYFIQKPFDREVLRTLVERCVELRRRREDHRLALLRLETEMAEARAFQQSLLPAREAVINRVAVCCRYTPCSALGGDLCDYAASSDGRTALLIADVSGHGVSAAMLTGIVKSAFYASHVEGFDPGAVVRRVSAGLRAFSPDRFVTLVAVLIAPDEGRLSYVNAGHPPVVLWGPARQPLWLASTGPLVSPVLPESTWDAPVIDIRDGDRLLLYTDGVSETLADEHGRAEPRLSAIIDRAALGGAALLDAILADVDHQLGGQPQPDDLTLLTASVLTGVGGGLLPQGHRPGLRVGLGIVDGDLDLEMSEVGPPDRLAKPGRPDDRAAPQSIHDGRPVARIVPIEAAEGGAVREALAAWTAAAGDDPTFADDLARVNAADRPAANDFAVAATARHLDDTVLVGPTDQRPFRAIEACRSESWRHDWLEPGSTSCSWVRVRSASRRGSARWLLTPR